MFRKTLIALVATASLVGIAAPAMADTAFGDGSPEMREFIADSIVTRLNQQGVNATGVEEWGDLVRAYVTGPDGTQTMQLFTPVSLQPVSR